jgi:hypothetical protein
MIRPEVGQAMVMGGPGAPYARAGNRCVFAPHVVPAVRALLTLPWPARSTFVTEQRTPAIHTSTTASHTRSSPCSTGLKPRPVSVGRAARWCDFPPARVN